MRDVAIFAIILAATAWWVQTDVARSVARVLGKFHGQHSAERRHPRDFTAAQAHSARSRNVGAPQSCLSKNAQARAHLRRWVG